MFQIYFIDKPRNMDSIIFAMIPVIKEESSTPNVELMTLIKAIANIF